MKTIILDIDDSITPLGPSLNFTLNSFSGQNIALEYWNTFNIIDLYNISIRDFYDCIIRSELLENLVPFPETKSLLTDLKNSGYNIKVITARGYHPKAEKITREWFNKYELPFDELIISEHGKKKCDYVRKEENVTLVIDDRIENCEEFLQCGKSKAVYLYDQPWNKKSSLPRIYNLNEVRKILNL